MRNLKTVGWLIGWIVSVTIVRAEPAIKSDEGLQQIHWADADKVIGEVVFVCGKVIDVRNIGHLTFINFDEERPPQFAGIVFRKNYENFPSDLQKLYTGKIVRIRGQITTYRDRPQIILTSADQIELLDKLPATIVPKKKIWPVDKTQLVVATYNTLNLFDDIDDPYHADDTTPAKSREQLEHLAQSIRVLNADVIAFQEVENRGYLKRFVDVFLNDMGYDHIVHYEGNDLRGIDVALISRVPVGPVRSHRHAKFTGPDGRQRRMSRDLLAVRLLPPGGASLELWVVHLKINSGGREYSEPIRLAEAQYIRDQLDKQLTTDPDASILVMGDFNDTWQSKSLQTIVGTEEMAMTLPLDEAKIDSLITFNHEPHRSMIDFILCSPAIAKRYVPGSYRAIPGSIETTGSDHNPVSARFSLR